MGKQKDAARNQRRKRLPVFRRTKLHAKQQTTPETTGGSTHRRQIVNLVNQQHTMNLTR
jgi:hypothetical protein